VSRRLCIAAAQYDIGCHAGFAAYAEKLTRWVGEAAAAGAQLLVFPEYGAMELASLFESEVRQDLAAQLLALQPLLPDFLALHADLAAKYDVYLCAASFPVRTPAGDYANRTHLVSPAGAMGHQDKQVMTRFERERWGISPGHGLKIFDTPLGILAVNVCYDAEFPLLARAQVEAWAQLLLVPSCTDTLAGYHRVRIACQARALEGQCYVVHACTVGHADWSEAIDRNVGAAAVFGPPDLGFPEDGVLACGELNRTQWVHAELGLARLAAVREKGQALNRRHWPEQIPTAAAPVERVAPSEG
jgi:predicted amidohydrolase